MSASGDAGSYGLPGMIARFVAQYPGIHVELSLTERAVDLVAEGFDLAIRAGKLSDSTLVARRVGNTYLHLFAAPSYLERRGHPRVLQDLAEHDCIVYRPHPGQTTWSLTGPNGEETVAVKGPVGCDAMGFVAQTVAEGAGIGLLPIELAREWLLQKRFDVVLREYRVTGAGLHIVMPSSTFVPSRVLLLRDHLASELAKELQLTAAVCTKEAAAYESNRTSASRTASSTSVAKSAEIRSGGARRRRESPWAAARRTSGK
jgi:DNA-binding transcriptional LysR family regulator